MKENTKILRKVLFTAILCLIILFLSQPKVNAESTTVTTIQELQEIMGATSCSTIDGTTLTITDNFTWALANDIDLEISEVTIDFNGKEITVENTTTYNNVINIIEGKIIFKDSQGEEGGIYCDGHLINVESNAELIIENGQYTAENGDANNGVIQNKNGIITINNGNFKCMNLYDFFQIIGGKMIINDGNFECKGCIIDVYCSESTAFYTAELEINNGNFSSETSTMLSLDPQHGEIVATLNGGNFYSSKGAAIGIQSAHDWGSGELGYGSLTLDGCNISAWFNTISLTPIGYEDFSGWTIDIVNCSLESLESSGWRCYRFFV